MSELTWLPRGLEQYAPPISQHLPVADALTYRAGGTRFVVDYSGAHFDPHFWLFIRATAKWRMGYDVVQRPTYELTLYRDEVFNVLLVDYWKPPIEAWRRNQDVAYTTQLTAAQDSVPHAASYISDNPSGTAVYTDAGNATTPTYTEG